MRFVFRRLKLNKKLRRAFVFFVVLSLGIGFAYIQSDLNINTLLTAIKGKWDLDITNITPDENSTATNENISYDSNKMKFNLTVPLNSLDDYYSFSFDIENNGNIEAKLNEFVTSGLTDEEKEYIDFTVTYMDSVNPSIDDGIEPGFKESIVVTVKFKDTSSITSGTYNLSIDFNYILSDGNINRIKTLYKVIEKEANYGSHAKLFTRSHQDSIDQSLTNKNIYYYKASTNNEIDEVKNSNNLIFANYCWSIFRTTDTGGVKLLYNGVPKNGKCNNTGNNSLIGSIPFNTNSDSIAYVGYMYNEVNPTKMINLTYQTREEFLDNISLTNSENYIYGKAITYDNGEYILSNTTQSIWKDNYSSLKGYYTCLSAENSVCSTVYYIVNPFSYSFNGYKMEDGNLLSFYNKTYMFGTGYTENDGVFTLTGTKTISSSNWYNNSSAFSNYYTCNTDSDTCTDLRYVTSISSVGYYYISSVTNNYKFSRNFTYADGNYILDDSTSVNIWKFNDYYETKKIDSAHYTCFNSNGVCSKVYYINDFYSSNLNIYYLELNDGINISQSISRMISSDNVNLVDSNIKYYIDNWYSNNMTDYTDYLEDVIFCGDRSIRTLGAFNPNGGGISTYLEFTSGYIKNDSYSSLKCTNINDSFSVVNEKAKLNYPIGLITYPELFLINDSTLSTGSGFWTMTPVSSSSSASVDIAALNVITNCASSYGVRPVVSLKPGTIISSGDGTKDNPYTIKMN